MDIHVLRDRVAARADDFVATLEAMVNIDCGSYSPDGVNHIADLCETRFREHGWEVDRRPHIPLEDEPQLGDMVIGTLRGAGGPRVLLIGHMDTVFEDGTAAERPYRTDGDRAFGPGVSDMKGGLLSGFFAVHALQDAGFDRFGTITYICNPDEEIGSPFSSSAIAELAPAHDAAFVLECARASGAIVSARKGVTDYVITVHGRAAHAGVEPEKGRSAVLKAAHLTTALHAMNDRWPGVTVNVGSLHGGTRPNIVPDRAELQVDLRSTELSTLQEAEREIERLVTTPTVPDVHVEVRSDGWHRPMEKTPASARLVELAVEVAAELGIPGLRDVATGGASDGNTTSAAGTPTLDGLGPIGGAAHAPGEWLDLASIVPRTTLLAGLITRL